MRFRVLVAVMATLLIGTLAPFAGRAMGTDDVSTEEYHVDTAPATFIQLNAPEVADPDVNATFTGTLRRDGEPSVEEWVDLMVDGEDMTHAITDENGVFSMETEMWEAPVHTVQAIASRGTDIEVAGEILTVKVRPVPPELWGTTLGDDSGENVPAVQGWARENTTVKLFVDNACELESVATATAEELDAGIPLAVADNTTTKIYANVTNDFEQTSDCSAPITYEEDSAAPVVESTEATPVDDGIEVTWSEPTDPATDEPEEVTTEACAAEGELPSAEACFEAPDAQVVEADAQAASVKLTNLTSTQTYTVATRFTDKVGNAANFLLATNLALSPYEGADAIQAKYNALGGAAALGADRSFVIKADGGWYKSYQNADIYYSAASGAHEVHGEIRNKLNQLGGTKFGFPTTDETGTPDGRGRYNHFTGNKSIYWTVDTGPHSVEGPIRDKWASIGWERTYGYPTSDTTRTPNGRGTYNFFENGRSIYWSPQTNAHTIYSPIRDKWASLGWENGFLGFPATDQTRTPDGQGEFIHFQGGSIYYSPHSGTHEIHGPIWDKWASVGFERTYGYPTTDVVNLPDGRGQYTHFLDGRSIYYTPQTGAHLVYGMIRAKWASMGWERGALGYPTSDEETYDSTTLRVSRFEGGSIVWNGHDAFYVRRVPVAAVFVSDDDGGRAATVSAGDVVRIVDFNNRILMKAGVQLVYNPVDTRGYRNTGTNNLTDNSTSDDVNVWMEQNFPNHLGIFFHAAGASGKNDMRFVFLDSSGGPTLGTLAHEVGHWLDLSHTFLDPTNYYSGGKGMITDTTPKVLAAAGGPGGEFRLDGDGFSDTPPDPGRSFVKNNLPTWECDGAFEVNSGEGWSLRFDPQRNNVMSYYRCGTADFLSLQQISTMRNAGKGWMIRDWRL